MLNYDHIYPDLVEVLQHIDKRIAEASCPPEQDIWYNEKLCEELSISTRTAAYWRSKKLIPYHKVEGIIFYLKSDVLALLKRNRVESISNKLKIK